MKISVIGLGHIGLVTALGFAQKGNKVVGIDVDRIKIDSINEGISPLHESPLCDVLSTYVRAGAFRASVDYNQILGSDLIFICVNTPANLDGQVNLNYIEQAAKSIGSILERENNYQVIVIRSTVPPGVTEGFILPILKACSKKKANVHFGLAVNPEFLQVGRAWYCFNNPDRVVIGIDDTRSWNALRDVYEPFSAPLIRTDIKTAEMTKYASNAFLTAKISFINEIGNICQRLGIDTYAVANGMGYDPRIGGSFLRAGIGFGGPCLSKDLQGLIHKAQELNYQPDLLQSVLNVNERQPSKMIEIAKGKLGDLRGKKVAILGLAFKSGTDEIRDSLATKIISNLLVERAQVKAYDPEAMSKFSLNCPGNIEYAQSANKAVEDADCVMIVTDWDEFREESLYQGKLVIDGRRILDPQKARQICEYYGICW